MKPLVTNENLEQLLKSFQNGLMKKIEDKFKEQNDRIEELESKLAIKQNIIDHLEIKCDDNEQYSRRSCLRIHGLDFSSDEDEGVLKKVEKCYSDMGIEFNQNEIDRAHYIGKPYMDKKKNKVRSIIVKFRSWKSRTAFYKARPRNHLDRQKKPGSSFNVSLDLTKCRYNLLIKAKGLITITPQLLMLFFAILNIYTLNIKNAAIRYISN